jgi:hypothetical protein
MTNQPDFRKLLEAWACGDAGAKQALADYMLEHAQEIVAAVNALPAHLARIAELEAALSDIATDKREHADDELAIIYRMQDRAKAALEGA